MSITSIAPVYPGAIVHISKFPFYDDPTHSKSRYGLVVAVQSRQITVRGIYTKAHPTRRRIKATPQTGLRYDSYIDARTIHIPSHLVTHVIGEAPYGYDPFHDFAA